MLKATMNPDGTVELTMGKESRTYTTSELEEQIERLARVRAQMTEKVPDDPPLIETVVSSPAYAVRMDNLTQASLLRIRHAGYGWLNFEFPARETLNMRRIWKDIVEKLGLEPGTETYQGPERRTKPH